MRELDQFELPDVMLRPAEPADVAAVRELLVETWHDTYDPMIGAERVTAVTNSWHSIEALARQIDMPNALFLVAELGDRIVGHAFARLLEGSVVLLNRLYVLPSFQRRGVGSALLSEIIARFPDARLLRLDVEAKNDKGLSFYRREGFKAVGESAQEGLVHVRMQKPMRCS